MTEPTTALTIDVPPHETEEQAPDRARFDAITARLSEQSLYKRFDAYLDVPWDDPEYAISSDDPRFDFSEGSWGLGTTAWYRAQPQHRRSEMGLFTIVSSMKAGREFESVLKRGLLGFAATLPDNDPAFRYSLHEVIEEAQHSLMFQEFVNRSGQVVPGMPAPLRVVTHGIVQLGHLFPELFFMFVLGGEEPIDRVQRETLRQPGEQHPLLERIMRIHITEEARHLSFAGHLLRVRVPELGPVRRRVLAAVTPGILGEMAKLMMEPSPAMIERFDIPRAVVREAFGPDNPEYAGRKQDSVRRIRTLCRDLGLVGPLERRTWRSLGIWADD